MDVSGLTDKLECLLGSHKFTEQWEIHFDTFNPKYLYVCVSCRKYAMEPKAFTTDKEHIRKIVKETPEYLWVQFYRAVTMYKKETNNTLVHVVGAPFGDCREE